MSENLCPYCLRPLYQGGIETDHIIPKSKCGTDDPENLIDCCIQCNQMKNDWDVSKVIGEDSTRDERIEKIKGFISWKKGSIITGDDDFLLGYG